MIERPRREEKGWGCEVIFADREYAGKLLYFKPKSKMSFHFHKEKTETWYVLNGKFTLRIMDLSTSEVTETMFDTDMVLNIEPFTPHQLETIDGGTIIEVSTPDSTEDNYRIAPGDSQCLS